MNQAEHTEMLESLKREIVLNPERRHRIILKAIKTAESREVQKAIRAFYKQNFRSK